VNTRVGAMEPVVLTGDNALDLGEIAGDPTGAATPSP